RGRRPGCGIPLRHPHRPGSDPRGRRRPPRLNTPMPLQLLDRPPTILTRAERPDPDDLAAAGVAASLALWAAGGVLLLGSLADLGILWTVQRQTTPQWEFAALLRTAETLPRVVIALALVAGALYLRGSTWLGAYGLIALGTLLLGSFGAAVAVLIAQDYGALSRVASAATEGASRAVAL